MHRLSAFLPAALLCASLHCSLARAQMPGVYRDASSAASYEQQASVLRNAEPQQYDYSRAMLGDVLRFLATDAGISFFSLPDDSPDGARLITFSINASPFQVLETLCRANGLAIIPDNGIWYIRPADDKELIGKSYLIKHNSLERVDRAGGSSGMGTAGGGGTGSSGGGAGVDIQGNQETFSVRRSEVINDIRSLLGLPPEESELGGQAGSSAAGASATTTGIGSPNEDLKAMNSNELSSFRKPKVIWKSDSNTLYIVATRLQHLWVEGYLEAADKPQPMISLEAKFIETARDPSRELGIDWTGTLETGNIRQVTDVTHSVDANGLSTTAVALENVPTNGGYTANLANLVTSTNLNAAAGALGFPALGILSGQDLNVKLRALLRDEETKMSSYPRMVTLNNREVSFRSVVNQPVLDASSSSSLGTGATTTQSVTYLPIGTILNILPRRMEGDKILLNMSITVSSIVGNAVIGGNPYPVASTRNYSAPVEMDSGYTVAVGGLDEAKEREGKAGVPFLHSIPGLGKLFKFDSKSKNHKNLMLFITPTIIDPRNGGLPDQPQSVVPQRPGGPVPKIPKVDPNSGALIGGPAALPNAVTFLERETDLLYRTVDEGRITPDDNRKVKELKIAVEELHAQCQILKQQYPGDYALIEAHQSQLQDLIIRNQHLAKLLFSKKYR